jgi:hypothetical protein
MYTMNHLPKTQRLPQKWKQPPSVVIWLSTTEERFQLSPLNKFSLDTHWRMKNIQQTTQKKSLYNKDSTHKIRNSAEIPLNHSVKMTSEDRDKVNPNIQEAPSQEKLCLGWATRNNTMSSARRSLYGYPTPLTNVSNLQWTSGDEVHYPQSYINQQLRR